MSEPGDSVRRLATRHRRCFWLDGGGARGWSGRRSMVGWLADEDVSLTYDASRREVRRHTAGRSEAVGADIFAALEAEIATGGPDDHWVGYFGYAARPDLPAVSAPPGSRRVPDAVWMRPREIRFHEHPTSPLAANDPASDPSAGSPSAEEPPPVPDWYRAAFAAVQEELRAGNSYEVNLTYRLGLRSALDPLTAYLRLRELNPAPYAGFLQHDLSGARAWLLSSSPERFAVIDAGRTLETKPIKGTTPRGGTPAEDDRQRERLYREAKFRSENLMIVDLLRNDLSLVCAPGSVRVPSLMAVESYRSVHQLVSTVRGRLRPDVTTVGALRALFPAGSMTGAPKLRTMQIIGRVEDRPRGVYAGAFGWVAADGRADLGVVIRSLVTAGDGEFLLGTGGGITVQSQVEDEFAEARLKAERLLRVFAG